MNGFGIRRNRQGPRPSAQAPGETELAAYIRPGTILEFIDEPDVDGTYIYAVASVREENSQEAVSGMSETRQVESDSVAPGSSENLNAEVVKNGIYLTWDAPAYTEPVSYNIYRSDQAEITSVEGMTPLIEGIPQESVVDPHPSPTEHCYAVTAVDDVGNWIFAYFEFTTDDTPPTITLTSPTNGSSHQSGITINLVITGDNGSLIYHWDNNPNQTVPLSTMPILPSGDGVHLLYCYASDDLGNWISKRFELDCLA